MNKKYYFSRKISASDKEKLLRFHRLKAEERRRRVLEEDAKRRREEEEERDRRREEFKRKRKAEKVGKIKQFCTELHSLPW